MRKVFCALLAVMIIVSCTACTVKDGDNSGGGTNDKYGGVVLNSDGRMAEIIGKTLNPAVNPYTIIYRINVDGTELEITQGEKDGMVYMEFEYDGMLIKELTDNVTGYHYAIYDSEKIVFKSLTPQMKIEPFVNKHEQLNKSFTTGNEEVNGVSYEYEKAEGDGGYLTLYFDASDKLCYMNANGVLMEVVAYDATIDSAYFELPDGYTVMEM